MRFVAWWLASNTGIACAGVVGTMLAAVIEVAASKGAKRRGFIVQAPSVRGWESQARRRGHREIPPSRRPPRAGYARQERRRRSHARHARHRSGEHTSQLQSLMRISSALLRLKNK